MRELNLMYEDIQNNRLAELMSVIPIETRGLQS